MAQPSSSCTFQLPPLLKSSTKLLAAGQGDAASGWPASLSAPSPPSSSPPASDAVPPPSPAGGPPLSQ